MPSDKNCVNNNEETLGEAVKLAGNTRVSLPAKVCCHEVGNGGDGVVAVASVIAPAQMLQS